MNNKPIKQIVDYKQYKKSLEEDKQRKIKHVNYLKIMKEMTDRYNKTGSTMTEQEQELMNDEIERENND